jgi:ATP-dependent DNA ligase
VPDLPFKKRVEFLKDLAEMVVDAGLENLIHVVHSEYIENQEQLDEFYAKALADQAEGLVWRNEDGTYEFGKRSYDVIKRKPRATMEVKVTGMVVDKNGDGVLTGITKDGKIVEFLMRKDSHPTINYRKAENAVKLIDHFVEIEYEELSDAGVPTKPVGIRLRQMIEGTWEPAE